MDIIAIILTIAACIGGLIVLYLIGALILFAVGVRQAKKWAEEDDFNYAGSRLGSIRNRR